MGSLNSNTVVNVFVEAAPVEASSFGLPLHMVPASQFGVGFTERSRRYSNLTEVNADEASNDITSELADLIKSAFQQTPRVPSVQIGRMAPGAAAQQVTLTYATDAAGAGEVHRVRVNGVTVEYVTVGTDTPTVITAALVALLVTALADEPVTPSDGGGVITLTADSDEDVFGYSAVTTSGTTTIATAVVQTGLDPAADLAAIIAEDDGFYGVTLQSRGRAHIEALAAEIESLQSEKRTIFLPQSSDLDIIAAGSGDLGSGLQANNYTRTGLTFRRRDNREVAFLVMVTRLSTNLDNQQTNWYYTNLVGVESDVFTTSERAVLEGKSVNFYGTFKKRGAYAPGRMANGLKIQQQTTNDWFATRGEESLANLLFDATARNSYIPFDDDGIERCAAVVRGVGQRGETSTDTPRHFATDSFSVTKPLASQIPGAEKQAGMLTLSADAVYSNSIEKVTVNFFVRF